MSAALQPPPVSRPRGRPPRRASAAAGLPLAAIGLGTCVMLCPWGGRAARWLTEEGVVIEIVPPEAAIQSSRVVQAERFSAGNRTNKTTRYVIQCWDRRVVRRRAEVAVVAW